MTTWILLDDAHRALRTAIAGVGPDGWDLPTPCDQWTVTQVLQHAAGDQLGYAGTLGVGTGPAYNPFAPSGQLDEDPATFTEQALAASAAAFAAVETGTQDVPKPLPLPPMSAEEVVAAAALDAAVHAWDIAVATGQASPLTPELSQALLPIAHATADPLRGFAYADALAGLENDDATAQLLRHLGRDPQWKP
ncbi:MAG: TIGR03086 family protein [Hamadaea sp.]|uniref:TIGR03086 family metal-binding protein n=1 Tax=Hamadaea sp. TaxID=2024425 RepID=UPI0017F7F0C9|nr:TIGR03086 family metal-binding protein [Hamadaea sp.]NUR70621.1 TIGR03086 family protein [Hamadaea sp.]NUT22359.1 TIGR03086 family protein [Hamadaea sp.]